jgi:phage/plasmid-associated DNA primase
VGDDGNLRNLSPLAATTVWDMATLSMSDGVLPPQCIWRSPYGKVPTEDAKQAGVRNENGRINFILDLAKGDEGVYDDIMQSLAPLVMSRKPDGVIWWVGDGANGKSTLMDAVYKIFPGQLSSITVKRLVDGRDTPSLNGTLANVVKESSEGRVDDTEVYKAIGTHENFRVHKFHSQDDIEVRGNVHHIFSANSIPTFNDKGYSARRRTFIIPFTARFESDPTFEERTFTPELFGALIMEMCHYARKLQAQGYKYKWSAPTLAAKLDYDTEANNAEEYARTLIEMGVVAFDSFSPVRVNYENWCADQGYVPLGIGNLRKACTTLGFERSSRRTNSNRVENIYKLASIGNAQLQQYSMAMPGMYTTYGFRPEEAPEDKDPAPAKPKQTILNNEW